MSYGLALPALAHPSTSFRLDSSSQQQHTHWQGCSATQSYLGVLNVHTCETGTETR